MRESSSNILEKMGSSRGRPGPTLLVLVGTLSQQTSGFYLVKFLLCLEYQRAKACRALSLVGRGDSDGREKHRGQDGPAVMMRVNVWRGIKGLSCFVFWFC